MSPAHQQPSFQQCREHQHTQDFSLKPPRAPARTSLLPQAATRTSLPQAATRASTREPSPSSRHAHQHTRASLKLSRTPAQASLPTARTSSIPRSAPRTSSTTILSQTTTRTIAYLSFASLQPAHTKSTAVSYSHSNFNYTLYATHNERAFLISLQLPANSLLIFSRLW